MRENCFETEPGNWKSKRPAPELNCYFTVDFLVGPRRRESEGRDCMHALQWPLCPAERIPGCPAPQHVNICLLFTIATRLSTTGLKGPSACYFCDAVKRCDNAHGIRINGGPKTVEGEPLHPAKTGRAFSHWDFKIA